MPSAAHQPKSRKTSMASASPSIAARVTCSPRTSSTSPPASSTSRRPRPASAASRASRPSPLPDANRSQQPRRPQGHGGPFGSTTMCPGSPAKPLAPRCNAPPVTMPPPMPVPNVTRNASFDPFAAPRRTSAHVAHVASLSTATGRFSRRCNSSRNSTPAIPGRFGPIARRPDRSTRPGTPNPTASSSPALACTSEMTPTMPSRSAVVPLGVGRRTSLPTRRPVSSTAIARIFVPPTSTPTDVAISAS